MATISTDLTGQQVGASETYYDDALRIDYQDAIREQFPVDSVLLSNIQKGDVKKIDTAGRFAQITLQKYMHPSVGAKPEGRPLPNKSYSRLETATVYMKHNYGRVNVSGPVMRASKNKQGANISTLTHETQAVMKSLRNDINRQLACGDGTGKLALANGSASSTTLTVDSALGIAYTSPSGINAEASPVKYLVPGMEIDLGDATTYTTIDVQNPVISSVDSATQATLTSNSSTWDDNAFVMRHDAASHEMMGLRGIIDDATHLAALQGITRSANSWWKSQVSSQGSAVSPATLEESMIIDLEGDCYRRGGEIDMILTTPTVYRSYAKLLLADRRFVNNNKLKGGFTAIDFNGIPIVQDRDCTPYTMYLIDKSTLEMYETSPISFGNADGQILHQTADYDDYQQFIYYDANLAVNNCERNGRLAYVQ